MIRNRSSFIAGCWLLGLMLAGLFAPEPLGIPIGAVAAACAVNLLIVAGKGHIISTRKVIKHAPWHIVVFSLGIHLVVYGLRYAGLTDSLSALLNIFAEHGVWAATLGTGITAALLPSLMNNMPRVLIGALSIQGSDATGLVREAVISASVLGCGLGPEITSIGSLATLLWLHVLAQKNIRVTWGYYFKVGSIRTLPILLETLVALALRLSIHV